MTLTTFQTNSVGPGVRIDAQFFERFVVLDGVSVVSTDNDAAVVSDDFVQIDVDGSVVGAGAAIDALGASSTRVSVGESGSLNSLALLGATVLLGENGLLASAGEVTATWTTAVIVSGADSHVDNHGWISGRLGVLLGLANDGVGNTLSNGGTISSSGPEPGDAVRVEAEEARVVNLAGGRIVAATETGGGIPGGAGIRATDGTVQMGQLAVDNMGEIASARGWGVDVSAMLGGWLSLLNAGTISGELGGVRGSAGDDRLVNAGAIFGAVDLGAGDDGYRARRDGLAEGGVDGGAGADSLRGGTAQDRLSGGGDGDSLRGGAGNDTLDGGGGFDTLRAGAGDDLVTAGFGADLARGYLGDDELRGENGLDSLYGGAGDDRLIGNSSDDSLHGGSGDDALFGGDQRDDLFGGKGEDSLNGGAADDTLAGGRGDDVLTGGSGDNVFVFRPGDGRDRVTNVVNTVDRIDLSAWGFADFADLQAEADLSATDDGVRARFGDGDVLTLDGITLGQLGGSDFLF